MITFKQALKTTLDHATLTQTESIPLEKSLYRILAQDVISDTDMPPFDKSAMDGYACKRNDLANILTVIEKIPAGYVPKKEINNNECSKIMTGGWVPEGANCVIMVEHIEELSKDTIRFNNSNTEDNICLKGEDIKAGNILLQKGDQVLPQSIAILAAVGFSEPIVACRPRVGIIATGSELVEPAEKLSGAKIRNSNAWQLAAQVEATGATAINYGIAADTEKAIDEAIKKAAAENDVIIISGGVSMGDFDLVPGVLKSNGIDILFDRVSIKPGKPSTFGVGENIRCFALPGNPVATFVQFEMLIKPFLFKMMGHNFSAKVIPQKLSCTLKRKRAKRLSVIPVTLDSPGYVKPVDYHGSAHINAMHNAVGFFMFPINETVIEKDTMVDVSLL
jgi:molybdopterin molybdotransferase